MPIVMTPTITSLFLDIGGVLATNGWDRAMRHRAAEQFHLDEDDLHERHQLTFDTYEEGKLSLDEYLARVVFCRQRPFSPETFKQFMFAQSQPVPEMIEMIRELKARHRLKIATLSNEGRELTAYRIEKFGLRSLVDFFICSCFVHCRKPDHDIYRIALDVAQVPLEQAAYIEDRLLFCEVGQSLGIHTIHHTNYESTRAALAECGLT
jgi:putative hydrolase of the HAD superfamily